MPFQFWKRKEKSIALEWGTIDFEANEVDRAGKLVAYDMLFIIAEGRQASRYVAVIRSMYAWPCEYPGLQYTHF